MLWLKVSVLPFNEIILVTELVSVRQESWEIVSIAWRNDGSLFQ